MNLVLNVLAGGGDTSIFLLPFEVCAWAEGLDPGSYDIPKGIHEAMRPLAAEEFNNIDMDGYATIGSGYNDVLLHLSQFVTGFDTVREALAEVAQHPDWTVVDQFHGHIY